MMQEVIVAVIVAAAVGLSLRAFFHRFLGKKRRSCGSGSDTKNSSCQGCSLADECKQVHHKQAKCKP